MRAAQSNNIPLRGAINFSGDNALNFYKIGCRVGGSCGPGRPEMTNQSFDAVRDAVARTLREHWKLFLIEGLVLVVLGLLAIAVPPLAGLAVTILFGWLFLISGVVGLVASFAMRQAPGFWWSLLSAALGILVGLLLLAQPLSGLV